MARLRKYPSGAEKRRKRKAKQDAAPPRTVPAHQVDLLEDGAADFTAQIRSGGDAASVYDEAIGFLRAAMRLSVTGAEGPMLERTARIAAALVKAVDPKRQVDELGAELKAAAKDIAELEERVRATRQPSGGTSKPPEAPIN